MKLTSFQLGQRLGSSPWISGVSFGRDGDTVLALTDGEPGARPRGPDWTFGAIRTLQKKNKK